MLAAVSKLLSEVRLSDTATPAGLSPGLTMAEPEERRLIESLRRSWLRSSAIAELRAARLVLIVLMERGD